MTQTFPAASLALPSRAARWLTPTLTDIFFVALLLWIFASGPMGWTALLADGDTGWHIRTGEFILDHGYVPDHDLFSYSKPGQTWYAWEWGADVIFALLHRAWGLKAIVLLAGILIIGSISVLQSHMIWRGANFFVALPLALIAVGVSSLHYLARPHAFTLFLLPVCLWILDRDRQAPWKPVWLLIPLAALWTNLHGGYMALIACLGLLVLATALECVPDWLARRTPAAWPALRRYALLTAGCVAATFVNPFGYRLHLHIANYLQSEFIHEVVQEFQSPSFRGENMRQLEFLLFLGVFTVGAALLRPVGTRVRDFAGMLWVVYWAHQSLTSVRHATIFVLVASPFIATVGSDWLRVWVARQPRKSAMAILSKLGQDLAPRFRTISVWALVFLAVLPWIDGERMKWPTDFPQEKFPLSLMHQHRELLIARRVLTTDQWGDYLIYQSYPRQRVFIDGRSDFYGADLGREYMRLMSGDLEWESILQRHRFDVVLAPRAWPLVALLKQHPDWELRGEDRRIKENQSFLFVRKAPYQVADAGRGD
ncbi:MAG: hypothetical protein K2X03_20710 [Bryobacteraceae bacterium]|nr:hypothetical protein [Bryobacteraceae bacterium]